MTVEGAGYLALGAGSTISSSSSSDVLAGESAHLALGEEWAEPGVDGGDGVWNPGPDTGVEGSEVSDSLT